MSDVVWAAVIAGGVGLAGNVPTYLTSKRAVDKAAEVELAKVRAELDRLRIEHREAERSHRQGTYHRTLAVLDRLDMFATGYHPETKAEYTAAVEEFNNMAGGILLFGAEPVREALAPLTEELERLGARIAELQREDTATSYSVAYGKAYRDRRSQILKAATGLTEAMRADVTREIHDEG